MRPPLTSFSACTLLALALAATAGAAACRDLEVVTASYATLAEARASGALERGWLPRGTPAGAHDIREAHDLDSNRRWGLFEFPPGDAASLRAALGDEVPLHGLTCNAPRRIEWWPVLLRGALDHQQIAATGIQAYPAREADLIFAVNWSQGRAYYWTRE